MEVFECIKGPLALKLYIQIKHAQVVCVVYCNFISVFSICQMFLWRFVYFGGYSLLFNHIAEDVCFVSCSFRNRRLTDYWFFLQMRAV